MKLVLDASALLAAVDGSGRVDAHILGAERLPAPNVIVSETLNALWKLTRAHYPAPSRTIIIDALQRLTLVPTIELAEDAATLAQAINHPAHDCMYAVLAQREHARFLTSDKRFAAKLSGIDVALF